MVTAVAAGIYHQIEKKCDDIGGDSLRQVLFAGVGLSLSTTFRFVATPLVAVSPYLKTGVLLVQVVSIAILFKNIVQWKNVVTHLFVVPLFSLLGIHLNFEKKEYPYKEIDFLKNGAKIAELKYQNIQGAQHAVATLYTQNFYDKGLALGYMTAAQVVFCYQKVLTPLIRFAQLRVGDTRGNWLDKSVNKYTIPDQYLDEMNGLVDGVNRWCEENNHSFRVTLDTIKRVHCFTDTYKMGTRPFINSDVFSYLWNVLCGDMGCSTMVLKQKDKMIAARTLDWPGMGMGEYALIRRDLTDDMRLVQSHAYPGILSIATALKTVGGKIDLVMIINECARKSLGSGIPCGLWVRGLIERCSNLDEVQNYVDSAPSVASSFHLTIADGKDAKNYQMLPKEDLYYLKRELSDEGNLVVTNHPIDPKTGEPLDGHIPHASSLSRFCTVTQEIEKGGDIESIVSRSLKSVNRPITIATQQFTFGSFDEGVKVVNANSFSSDKF